MGKVIIKQTKSGIDRSERRKIHQQVELEATPQVMGMINKVRHLITVEEK